MPLTNLSTKLQERKCFQQSIKTKSLFLLYFCFLFVQLLANSFIVLQMQGDEMSDPEKGVFIINKYKSWKVRLNHRGNV